MEKSKRNLHKDKVEISVTLLIEIERAFNVLIKDKESYIHKVFSDDYVFTAIKEIKEVYNNYFEEETKL